ncbi:MAG: hypothetical protein H7Z12_02330 [Rhodospirillaceae bacterium]|nr:hypothetical protein [Rhodospirillales bacterium]
MLVIAAYLGLHAALVLSGVVPALVDGQLVNLSDPDSYARALRLERYWRDGHLGDGIEKLINAPYGMALHWTRVVDVVALALTALVQPFAGTQSPVFLAGMAFGPFLHLAVLPLFLWAARPILSPGARLAACLIFLLQPVTTFNFVVGTLDHHGLMALLALAIAIFTARALSHDRLAWAAAAGGAGGLAVWLSPEGIVLLVPVLAAFGVLWLRGDRRAMNGALAFSLTHLAIIAVAVTVEGQWPVMDLYKVSQIHAVLAALMTGTAALAVISQNRLVVCVAGALGLAGLWRLCPGLFADPQITLDPVVRQTMIDAVGVEGPLSLATPSGRQTALLGLGIAVPAMAFSLWALWRRPAPQQGRHVFALLSVAVLVAYVLLGKARGLHYVTCFALLPWAECLMALAVRRKVLAVMAGCAQSVLGGALVLAAEPSGPVCPTAALARHLGRAPVAGPVILADLFAGPELAYRTGYGVLGAPYDQNVAGITDTARLFGAHGLGPEFWRLMAQRQVRAVVLCRFDPPQAPPGSLAARLLAGDAPAGFTPVPLPPDLAAAFVLYGVQP